MPQWVQESLLLKNRKQTGLPEGRKERRMPEGRSQQQVEISSQKIIVFKNKRPAIKRSRLLFYIYLEPAIGFSVKLLMS
jgi:hypothetical protein